MLYFIGMDIKFHKTNTKPETLNEGEIYFVNDEHAIYVGESEGESKYSGDEVNITYSNITAFSSSNYGFDMFPFHVSNNEDINNNNRVTTLFKIKIPAQQGAATSATYNASNSIVSAFLTRRGLNTNPSDSWFYIMDPKKNFSLGSNIQTYMIPASVSGNGTYIYIQWIGLNGDGLNVTPYIGTYAIQVSSVSGGNIVVIYKEDLLSSGSTSDLETVVLDVSNGTISNDIVTKLKNGTCRLQVTNAMDTWNQKNDAVCVFTDDLAQLKISLISGQNGFTFGYYQINISGSASTYSLGEFHKIDIVNNGDGTKYLSDNGTYNDKFSNGGTQTITTTMATGNAINTSDLDLNADFVEVVYNGTINTQCDFHKAFSTLFPNRNTYPQYMKFSNSSNYVVTINGVANGTFAYSFDKLIIPHGQWVVFKSHKTIISIVGSSSNYSTNYNSCVTISNNNGIYLTDSYLTSKLPDFVTDVLTTNNTHIPLYFTSGNVNDMNRMFQAGYNYNGSDIYISNMSPQINAVRFEVSKYNKTSGAFDSRKFIDVQMAGDGNAFLANDGTYKGLITTGAARSVSSLASLSTSTAEKAYDLLTVNITTSRSLVNDFKTTLNNKFFTQTNKVQYLQVKYNGSGTYRITTTGTVSGNSWKLGFSEIILNGAGIIEFSGLNNFITANVSNNGTIY